MEEAAQLVQTTSYSASMRDFLDRLFDPIFSAYVFTTIFLPSGSIYGLNLKLPLYLLLLPLALLRFFRTNSSNTPMMAMMLSIPAFLSLWIAEGVLNGFGASGATRQYTDIVLTLLMCWLAFLFCKEREDGRLRFLRLVLSCEVATCLFKSGIILYSLARGVPVVTVVKAVSLAFGTELMTMDLGSLFGRVQFVSDALIPICIFMVVRHREKLRIGPTRAIVTILLLLTSVIFSFSRYFWGYSAVAFVLGLLLGKRDRFKAALVTLLTIVILVSLPALSDVVELRFSDSVTGSSDIERAGQSEALQHFFLDAPLLGHGLGSYTTQVLRSTENEKGRYGYEMQLLALAGQTGLVGIAFFLLLLIWYYRRLFVSGPLLMPDRLGLGLLLIVWIAAGLYNPLLESPVASVSYACLATMSALGERSTRRIAAS